MVEKCLVVDYFFFNYYERVDTTLFLRQEAYGS